MACNITFENTNEYFDVVLLLAEKHLRSGKSFDNNQDFQSFLDDLYNMVKDVAGAKQAAAVVFAAPTMIQKHIGTKWEAFDNDATQKMLRTYRDGFEEKIQFTETGRVTLSQQGSPQSLGKEVKKMMASYESIEFVQQPEPQKPSKPKAPKKQEPIKEKTESLLEKKPYDPSKHKSIHDDFEKRLASGETVTGTLLKPSEVRIDNTAKQHGKSTLYFKSSDGTITKAYFHNGFPKSLKKATLTLLTPKEGEPNVVKNAQGKLVFKHRDREYSSTIQVKAGGKTGTLAYIDYVAAKPDPIVNQPTTTKEGPLTETEKDTAIFSAISLTPIRTTANEIKDGEYNAETQELASSLISLQNVEESKQLSLQLTTFDRLDPAIKNKLSFSSFSDNAVIALVTDQNGKPVLYQNGKFNSQEGNYIAYPVLQEKISELYNYESFDNRTKEKFNKAELQREVQQIEKIVEIVTEGKDLKADIDVVSGGVMEFEKSDKPLRFKSEGNTLKGSDLVIHRSGKAGNDKAISKPFLSIESADGKHKSFVYLKGMPVQDTPQLDIAKAIVSEEKVTNSSNSNMNDKERYNYLKSILGVNGLNQLGIFLSNDKLSYGKELNNLSKEDRASKLEELLRAGNYNMPVTNLDGSILIKSSVESAPEKISAEDYIETYSETAPIGNEYLNPVARTPLNSQSGEKQFKKVNRTLSFTVSDELAQSRKVEEETNKAVNNREQNHKITIYNAKVEGSITDEITISAKDLLDSKVKAGEISQAKADEALEWYNKSAIKEVAPLTVLFNVVNSTKYASWGLSGITLYKGSDYTYIYHEAWHAFTQMFLTKQEKNNLYNELRKNKGSFTDYQGKTVKFAEATWLQLEEYLAEEFRKYAMAGGKKELKGKEKKNIFQKIWNFIRTVFNGNSNNKTSMQDELFDKLYTGKLSGYKPSSQNVTADVLNSGIKLKDQSELTYMNSIDISESMDYIIAETLRTLQTNSSEDILSKVYGNEKAIANFYKKQIPQIIANRANAVERALEAEQEKPVTDNAVIFDLENKLATFQIMLDELQDERFVDAETGEVTDESVIDRTIRTFIEKQNKPNSKVSVPENIISFHLENSIFPVGMKAQEKKDKDDSEKLDLESEAKSSDMASSDEDFKQDFDKVAGEDSAIDNLDGFMEFVLSSLVEVDTDGKEVLNTLGFPKLLKSRDVANSIQNITEGWHSVEMMYQKLNEAATEQRPYLKSFMDMMGPLDATDKWSSFFHSFESSRIKYAITITHYDDSGKLSKITTMFAPGNARQVERMISRRFNTEVTGYKQKDSKGYYLDIDAVLGRFGTNFFEYDKVDHTLDFLKALNILDDSMITEEFKKSYAGLLKDLKPAMLMAKLKFISEYNKKAKENDLSPIVIRDIVKDFLRKDYTDHIKKTKNVNLIGTFEGSKLLFGNDTKMFNSAQANYYSKLRKYLETENTHNLFDAILKSGIKFTQNAVITAEGKKAYENIQGSSMSKVVDAVNNYDTKQELLASTEWQMLKDEYNPFIKYSKMMNAVYDNSGNKRLDERGLPVRLDLYLEAGASVFKNGVHEDSPSKGALGTTANTKLHVDLTTFFNRGFAESFAHADKGTRVVLSVSSLEHNPDNKHANGNILIDHHNFADPTIAKNALFDEVRDYVLGEYERIQIAKEGKAKYQKFNTNGSDWVIFNGIFSENVLKKISAVKGDINMLEESDKETVKSQLLEYFDDVNQNTSEIFAENPLVNNEIVSKIANGLRTNYLNSNVKLEGVELNEMLKSSNAKIQSNPAMVKKANEIALYSYTVNTWFNKLDSLFYMYGDLANFKNPGDFIKRSAAIMSTGGSMRDDAIFLEELNSELENNSFKTSKGLAHTKLTKNINTGILNDVKFASTYLKSLLEQHSDQKAIKDNYDGMTEADAQGLITFDMYRAFNRMVNSWTPAQEEAYQEIIKDPTGARAQKLKGVFPPKKFQYYGPLGNLESGAGSTMAFHKYSLAPLIPGVYSKGSNAEKLHNKMMEQDVHYVVFESGSKLDNYGENENLYSDLKARTFNENMMFDKNIVYTTYLKEQLEIAPKYKNKVTFPTQLRKLITKGIYSNGSIMSGKKELAGYVKNYDRILKEMVDFQVKEIEDLFNNPDRFKELVKYIENAYENNDLTQEDIIEFRKAVDLKNKTINGEALSTSDKLEKVILSYLKKTLKPKVKGEMFTQLASTSFENPTTEQLEEYSSGLKYYTKDQQYMEVKVGINGDFRKLLKDPAVKELAEERGISELDALNQLIKNEKWLEATNENGIKNVDAITMIGVRIPTQGLNSMEHMRIAEFLPETVGAAIIPPSEIVAKTGSDFDIDKMTVLTAYGKPNGKQQELHNELMGEMKNILSHPENFEALTKPLDTDALKSFMIDDVLPKEVKSGNYSAKVLEPSFNLKMHESMGIAKEALGIAAVFNTFKVLFDQIDFKLKDPGIALNANRDSKGNLNFGNTLDVNGDSIDSMVNEIMNGLLDVAKEPWIFEAHGSKLMVPKLLSLIGAGVPFRDAILFLRNPLIKKFEQEYYKLSSPFSKYMAEGNPETEALKNVAESIDFPVGTTMTGATYVDKKHATAVAEKAKGKSYDKFTDEETFATFFNVVKLSQALTAITTTYNYDTKDLSNAGALISKTITRDKLAEENELIEESELEKLDVTIPGIYNQTDLFLNSLSKFFPNTLNEDVKKLFADKDFLRNFGKGEYGGLVLLREVRRAMVLNNENFGTTMIDGEEFYNGMPVKNQKIPVKTGVNITKYGAIVDKETGVMIVDEKKMAQDFLSLNAEGASVSFRKKAWSEDSMIIPSSDMFNKDFRKYKEYVLAKAYAYSQNEVTQKHLKTPENYKAGEKLISEDVTKLFNENPNRETFFDTKTKYKAFEFEGRSRVMPENALWERDPDSGFYTMYNVETGEVYYRDVDLKTGTQMYFKGDSESVTLNTRKKYETDITAEALTLSLNDELLFFDDAYNYASQLLRFITPRLMMEYPVLAQLSHTRDEISKGNSVHKKNVHNLIVLNRFPTPEEITQYKSDIKDLADPTIMKLEDPVANKKLAELLSLLPAISMRQTGFGKAAQNSLHNIIPNEMMNNYIQESQNNSTEIIAPSFRKDSVDFVIATNEQNAIKNRKYYNYSGSRIAKVEVEKSLEDIEKSDVAFGGTNAKAYSAEGIKKAIRENKPMNSTIILEGSLAPNGSTGSGMPGAQLVIKDTKHLDLQIYKNLTTTLQKGNLLDRKTLETNIDAFITELNNLNEKDASIAFHKDGYGHALLREGHKDLYVKLSQAMFELTGYKNKDFYNVSELAAMENEYKGITRVDGALNEQIDNEIQEIIATLGTGCNL